MFEQLSRSSKRRSKITDRALKTKRKKVISIDHGNGLQVIIAFQLAFKWEGELSMWHLAARCDCLFFEKTNVHTHLREMEFNQLLSLLIDQQWINYFVSFKKHQRRDWRSLEPNATDFRSEHERTNERFKKTPVVLDHSQHSNTSILTGETTFDGRQIGFHWNISAFHWLEVSRLMPSGQILAMMSDLYEQWNLLWYSPNSCSLDRVHTHHTYREANCRTLENQVWKSDTKRFTHRVGIPLGSVRIDTLERVVILPVWTFDDPLPCCWQNSRF